MLDEECYIGIGFRIISIIRKLFACFGCTNESLLFSRRKTITTCSKSFPHYELYFSYVFDFDSVTHISVEELRLCNMLTNIGTFFYLFTRIYLILASAGYLLWDKTYFISQVSLYSACILNFIMID